MSLWKDNHSNEVIFLKEVSLCSSGALVRVRGQLSRVCSLFHYVGSGESNSVCQNCQKVFVPAKPSWQTEAIKLGGIIHTNFIRAIFNVYFRLCTVCTCSYIVIHMYIQVDMHAICISTYLYIIICGSQSLSWNLELADSNWLSSIKCSSVSSHSVLDYRCTHHSLIFARIWGI